MVKGVSATCGWNIQPFDRSEAEKAALSEQARMHGTEKPVFKEGLMAIAAAAVTGTACFFIHPVLGGAYFAVFGPLIGGSKVVAVSYMKSWAQSYVTCQKDLHILKQLKSGIEKQIADIQKAPSKQKAKVAARIQEQWNEAEGLINSLENQETHDEISRLRMHRGSIIRAETIKSKTKAHEIVLRVLTNCVREESPLAFLIDKQTQQAQKIVNNFSFWRSL